MQFSILFWNIWYMNQTDDYRRKRLLRELTHLVKQHKPTFIALSEVIQGVEDKTAAVTMHLNDLGYRYDYCTQMAQFDDYWMSGVTLSSQLPIIQKQRIAISANAYAAKHGHPGLSKEVIAVNIGLPENRKLKIIVAHPVATVDSLAEHKSGKQRLNQLVRSKEYASNTILVGDMNEWRLMPGSFRSKVADIMHSQTGSFMNPTWHYNAHNWIPLHLNLDYVYWSKEADFKLTSFEVLKSKVSDHRPILAVFQYK